MDFPQSAQRRELSPDPRERTRAAGALTVGLRDLTSKLGLFPQIVKFAPRE